jgi:hypothetical protein
MSSPGLPLIWHSILPYTFAEAIELRKSASH